MKKRIRSLIICIGILFGMSAVSVTNAEASNDELKKVDGSYLTLEDSSIGTSSSNLAKGKHMMDGECSISKAGTNRVYAFGATTANHEVDFLAVVVYVDRYHEETDDWGQVDWWMVEDANDYFVYSDETLSEDRVYYYLVQAEHFVLEGDDLMEETFSYTFGIWVVPSTTTE